MRAFPMWWTRRRCALLSAFVAVAALAGCVSPRSEAERQSASSEIVKSSVRFQKEYLLFAGDQIEVSVWRVPEVSRTVTVAPDGKISLPLLQDVPAAGLSARELAEDLKARLSSRLLNPTVTVIPVTVRQPMVYVLGDVKNPSAVPYRSALTALQAIGMAGGLQRTSADRDVSIVRLSRDGYLQALPIDAEAGGQPGAYLAYAATRLEPDDIVFVPESNRSQVVRFLNELVLLPTQLLLNYKLLKVL